MRSSVAVALLCLTAITAVAAGYHHAVARLHPTIDCRLQSNGNCDPAGAWGLVYFDQNEDLTVTVNFTIAGLVPNTEHAIHIHQWGDLSNITGSAMGTHWNPAAVAHECPFTVPRHAGDFGYFTSDSTGWINAVLVVEAGQFVFFDSTDLQNQSPKNALGHGIVVHGKRDECSVQPTGDAGLRVMYGVIGVANNGTTASSASSLWSSYPALVLAAKLYDSNLAPLGQVFMRQSLTDSSKVQVYLRASGLIPGSVHGIHVHQYGDHSLPNAVNAGGHWNPWMVNHNMPYITPNRHVGDLGNVIATAGGEIYHNMDYDTLVLSGPSGAGVVGLGFVLHAWPDLGDFSTTNGASGPRQAMGVLGIAPSTAFPTTLQKVPIHSAFARMFPTSGAPNAFGWVRVDAGDDNMAIIKYSFSGLAANSRVALHIHEFGDLTDLTGTQAGGHFNPWGFPHSCAQNASRRHVGDIGNLPYTDSNGQVSGTLYRDWISLAGTNSTVGRALILHSGADDCVTQPTGGAGSRNLYGVLGLVGNATNVAVNPGVYPIKPITTLVAKMSHTKDATSTITGNVWFTTDPTNPATTLVYVDVTGITPGSALHGFHVHYYGDWSGFTDPTIPAGLPNGNNAGAHWNPGNQQHALPGQTPNRHAGDMGNLYPDANGRINEYVYTQTNNLMPLKDLIGRGVVIHALQDSGQTAQPAGAAGLRIALGVIGIAQTAFPFPLSTGNGAGNNTGSTGEGCLGCNSGANANVHVSLLAVAFAVVAATKFARL